MPPKKPKSSSSNSVTSTSENKQTNKGQKSRSLFSRKEKESSPAMNNTKDVKPPASLITGNEPKTEDVFAVDKDPIRETIVVVDEDNHQSNAKQTESNVEKEVFLKQNDSSTILQPEKLITTEPATATNPDINNTDNNDLTPSASSSSVSIRFDDDKSLSTTVTRLTTANGSEVYLIGTAHFSTQSVLDVQKLIRAVKPSSVVLELCGERVFMLSLDEESLLEQNRKLSFDKIRNAIAEKGLAQGLIYIMFIKMSANITEKLGLAPGSEFRAGSAEAEKIPGCSVVLADRSLKVTVARAVASVSTWQKLKLIYHVLVSDTTITQEDIEKCKDKDILEQLLQELGGQFPGFKRVLLDERNVYLAHSIYNWAERTETSMGPPKIVAIVGIGHVAGIIENWGKTTEEQMRELNEVPTPSRTRRVVQKTIKYCTIALIVYVGYRALTPTSIQTALQKKILG